MIIVNQYIVKYNNSPFCSCYPKYWKVLVGILVEMHNSAPEEEIRIPKFRMEANVAYTILKNMNLGSEVNNHVIQSVLQLKNFCHFFCYVLSQHPQAQLRSCLLELNRNMNF